MPSVGWPLGRRNYVAKCWLAIGQEATKLLAELGDRENLRPVALLVVEVGNGVLYSR